MNNQYQQPDFELGWDDELTVDQEELVTLRPGEYIFTIIGFDRKRYEPKAGSRKATGVQYGRNYH